jgi:hypothetical protein
LGRVREVGSNILRPGSVPLSVSQLNSLRAVLLVWQDTKRFLHPYPEIPKLTGEDMIFNQRRLKREMCATQAGLIDSTEFGIVFEAVINLLCAEPRLWTAQTSAPVADSVSIASLDPLFIIAILGFGGIGCHNYQSGKEPHYCHTLTEDDFHAIDNFLLEDELKFMSGRRSGLVGRKGQSIYLFAVMPEATQVDDIVYYLEGDSVPFVLRNHRSTNTYVLIGMCYACYDLGNSKPTDVEEIILV